MSLILFETSESVIELLWDVALAFFIVRIALSYFLLTFASGLLLSYLFATKFVPLTHLTLSASQAELSLAGLHALLMAFWARFIVVHYEVPRVRGFRLAIGLVACGMMLLAEAVLGLVMYEEGYGGWLFGTGWAARTAFALSLGVYALLPVMMMGLEGRRKGEILGTTQGHEKKPVTAAVPTVGLSDKKGMPNTK